MGVVGQDRAVVNLGPFRVQFSKWDGPAVVAVLVLAVLFVGPCVWAWWPQ